MKKMTKLIALFLCVAMVLSLFGCTAKPNEPQVAETTAPIETTVPEPTEVPPTYQFEMARSAVENAENLELAITISENRTVNGDTYSETTAQTVAMQGRGTDALTVSMEQTVTSGENSYTSQEFYTQGTAYLLFDGTPFSSEISQEDYESRLIPAVLLDEALYEDLSVLKDGSTTVLTYSQPTAGESWAVPESAELVSATAAATLDADGNLVSTEYTVSYQYGPTLYDLVFSAAITMPESLALTNPISAADEEYVALEYIDAPALLYRAMHDMHQAPAISGTTIDTMITYAGGAVFSQQENIDLYGTGADALFNYEVDITLEGAAGVIDEYSLTENTQNKRLTYTENDGEPASQLLNGSTMDQIRDTYLDSLLSYFWTPKDLTGATITDLGSVYLLEMTGSDALGEILCADACSTFWMDENFLNNLASSYHTAKLEAYLSIDKYTQLPVAFGFAYEGVHEIEGMEFTLSDQWDQTMFLSSTTAYTAVTEEPLPDEEPENKATPLFYHVTGPNGQEMWLLGTIHVGDARTAYLPQEIYDALDSSDALALEFNMDAFNDAMEEDDALIGQVASAYFYADGSMTKDHLDEEVYEAAVQLMKATGNYFMNAEYLKPYLWSQSIDNFYLRQGYGLVSEKGVDQRLLDRAQEKGMEILDIESGLFQLQMMTGYSDELQELLLTESLGIDSAEYCASTADLYEKWCAGDEAVMRQELSNEVDTSEFTEEELAEYEAQKPYIDEYNKAMSYDRNEGMLRTAIDYLESGRTIFYAVGLAHLLDNVNGLVDTLREAGYTVELVNYQ